MLWLSDGIFENTLMEESRLCSYRFARRLLLHGLIFVIAVQEAIIKYYYLVLSSCRDSVLFHLPRKASPGIAVIAHFARSLRHRTIEPVFNQPLDGH
ncbi:hypothetical protein BJX99DRAFT_38310 [Aspergillus californicus]